MDTQCELTALRILSLLICGMTSFASKNEHIFADRQGSEMIQELVK